MADALFFYKQNQNLLKISYIILFLVIHSVALAQRIDHDPLIGELLERMASLQVTQDPDFLPGIYPSYINHKESYAARKKDLTIFYNALIDKTLQQISPSFTANNKAKVAALLKASAEVYPRFKNQKGRNTYNFWVTDSTYTFPYSWWIPLIKKDPHVPDDMDDTSISHLALQSSRDSAAKVHLLFQQFINDTTKLLKTAPKKYRQEAAYSTWFGKNFPVVFDISVLANTLFFVQSYDLPWTASDSASLRVILKALDTRDYFKKARLISPYYGKPAIIMYHISRLMQVKKIPELEARRIRMMADTKAMYITSRNVLEKVILSTTLRRWGVTTGYAIEIDKRWQKDPTFIRKEIEQSNYSFFIGNIPSYFPYGFKKVFTKLDALFYYHYCPAYNNVLLLEYLSL